MQVRFANRQDEKGIRELAEALSIELGASLDLKGNDSDLVNIDANYFGHQGLFLVVEDEGEIAGFAGARAKSEEILQITRFYVIEKFEVDEVVNDLLRVIVEFAPRLLYSSIECDTAVALSALNRFEFQQLDTDKLFKLDVRPDF